VDVNTEVSPPVVAVVVVHDPGDEFDDVLGSLADQDYPNLKALFLLTGADDLTDTIRAQLPNAFVRAIPDNPGYGAAANEVLHLVEGDNGFFLLMHDDVALDVTATRLLVEELYRSNAGIVGPKLVLWDEPHVLQHVGLGVDRFGEIDPLVEPGEFDQEQHDAVRDVFALPSACMLVRADLFRSVGGFDASSTFHGEDLDLCWRAHLSGARVVVVPAARARHLEQLSERRADMAHRLLAARHRVRTVAVLTGGLRLPLVLVQMLLLSLLELVVGLFTGRLGEAFASLRATVGLLPRLPSIVRRRREVAELRHVPYREVAGLQIRGSARLASYLRTREQQHMSVDHSAIGLRRFSRNTAGQLAAWLSITVLALLGSRGFILHGVPAVGEYLHFPARARTLIGNYWSGWWAHGLGQTTAVPTGVGLLGVVGVFSVGHMALLHTVAVLAWLPIGYYGAWRLMSIFPSSRARIAGLLVYAAVPLPYGALGAGRWGVVAAYGATPWVVHLLRKIATIEPALTARADADVADAFAEFNRREQLRRVAQLTLLTAAVTAFTPIYALIVAVIGLALAIATVLARGLVRAALTLFAGATISGGIALLINLPWVNSLVGANGWDAFVGVPASGSPGLGLARILRFDVGPFNLGVLAIAMWLPVVAAPLLARGWRLTWAARGGVLSVGFLALAVVSVHGAFPFRLPELGLLLAPAAVGLSIAAACAAAAFEQDVQGGSFGWRQPLGILSGIAILIGVVPAIASTSNGHWSTPANVLLQPSQQFAANPVEGDYRTLFVGDARLLPVPGWRIGGKASRGVSYAVIDDGPLFIGERWPGLASAAERELGTTVELIGSGATSRVGRLLAPYAIRYIVVPVVNGLDSTATHQLPAPAGLLDGLNTQLDLRRLYTPPNYIAFENVAWIPTQSMLGAAGAAASKEAGAELLAKTDVSDATPVMVGMNERGPGSGAVTSGVLHVARPFDAQWQLRVNGQSVPGRIAFSGTTAYDVSTAGDATLGYHTATTRHLAVLLQFIAWLLLCIAASRMRWGWLRARRAAIVVDNGPILNLGDLLDPLRLRAVPDADADADTDADADADTDADPDAEADPDSIDEPLADGAES
jgi:GT2 family glycosyltransferase